MEFNTKHKPKIENYKGKRIYKKYESDDNFLFKKLKTITINAETLEEVDVVRIEIPHRKVVVGATKEEIKDHKTVMTFYGETKFHYPVEKWTVLKGSEDWFEGL